MKKLPLFLMLILLCSAPMTVYAGEANAVNDILNNQRYEGAIQSIQAVTEVVDTGFTMFITFIAFFIISAAMLRNVLAGAYCAYPKFFDKVDAAHKEVADTGWVQRIKGLAGNYENINSGSIGKAMLRLIPNIKTLTDFEEESLEPRSYFIKAIPQMIFVVIIGVFIYNGYYRDTAAVVSNFGSEMFRRVILSADPVAIFDRIAGTSGRPEFSSDSLNTDAGELQNKIAEKAYSKIISTYNDVTGAANKSAIASALDSWVGSELTNCSEYSTNHANWAYSFDVSMSIGPTVQTEVGKVIPSADGLKAVYVFNSLPVSSLQLDTTKEQGVDWYLNVTINFKKRAAVVKYKIVNDLKFTLNSSVSDKKIKLPASTDGGHLVVYGTGATIGGKKVKMDDDGNLTFPDGVPSDIKKDYLDCTGVKYRDSNGREHTVSKFKLGGTTGLESSAFEGTIRYGDAIEIESK